jgi:hypothetical protein
MVGFRLSAIFTRNAIDGQAGRERGEATARAWLDENKPSQAVLEAAIESLGAPQDDYDRGYLSVLDMVPIPTVSRESGS